MNLQFAQLRFSLQLAMIAVLVISQDVFAQQEPVENGKPSIGLARAKQIMEKIDKDSNGTFEKGEDDRTWKRYRQLDTNQDQVLSIEELGKLRPAPPAYLETGGQRKLDLVYKTIDQRKLLLDLYYPTGGTQETGPPPIIVYTHGGGWAAGSKQGIAKSSFKVVFLDLLKRGFAVASVNYRLCKKNSGVTMRDCVVDSKDAIRYLAKNSESLNLDSERFFVMGDSAGGHIAQMLLLSAPEALPGDKDLASTSFKLLGGVSWYGPCDFEKTDLFNHDDRADFRDRFGPRILGAAAAPAETLARYREVSPVNYLNANSPPLLMIQGDKDTTIPVKHAHFMKQKAASVKAPVETMIVKNAGHNWRKVGDEIKPSRAQIEQRTVQFFVDHLTSAAKKTFSPTILKTSAMKQAIPDPISTLGLAPPNEALVLFDGSNFDAWKPFSWQWINSNDDQKEVQWKMVDGKAMQIAFEFNGKRRKQFLCTKKQFGDYRLHLEFQLPEDGGQGNSGIFFGPLYELQILDSAGKGDAGMGDCGAIYQIRVPDVNAALEPGKWQTVDLEYQPAKIGANGFMTEKGAARVTVRLNGKLIHDDFKLSLRRNKYAGFPEEPTSPIVLQAHGSPVMFRNIWLIENDRKKKK